jgi:putative pyruvate formate lyase activating enzyme
VASHGPHFGEERPISGRQGSGTVFFSGCNLHCLFCQNYDISQRLSGLEVDDSELAEIFLDVQRMGCHNLNLVSPSHVVPQITTALVVAIEGGFRLPIVYNSGGYESLEILRLLDGVIDVYMPDLKYADGSVSGKYSDVPDYPEKARTALREMHRQVGDLAMDDSGVARRGLLVRHLVLPEGLAGSEACFRFLADELSPDTYVNVMDQYRPSYRAYDYPQVSRRLTREEFAVARRAALDAGLLRLD